MSLVENYLAEYIDKLQPLCRGKLGEIQADAYERGLPIIPNEVVKLMGFILGIHKPAKILEIGMAVGFSAGFMETFLPEDGSITTIDRYPMMIEEARKNFKALGIEDRVKILTGDANDILPTLEGNFDFVFMDAAKGQYIYMLPHVLRLTRKGGIIMVDDVLQDGRVAQGYTEIPRRQRTIHKRLNDFLHEITHNEKLRTAVLSIGDGVALIEKLED